VQRNPMPLAKGFPPQAALLILQYKPIRFRSATTTIVCIYEERRSFEHFFHQV
jgi:hypothetical protein